MHGAKKKQNSNSYLKATGGKNCTSEGIYLICLYFTYKGILFIF